MNEKTEPYADEDGTWHELGRGEWVLVCATLAVGCAFWGAIIWLIFDWARS